MSKFHRNPTVILIVLFAFALAAASGCTSRPAAAQRLFEKGQYREILERYPDLEIARRAQAKLAEKLLKENKYADILREFPQTPAAYKAREGMAQKLFEEGRFQSVIDSFPNSPQAQAARLKLSDSLFAAGQMNLLIQKFPETPRGKQAREDLSAVELARVKKLKGTEYRQALEQMMRTYAGTAATKEASQLLSKARSAEFKQKKK